MAGDYTVVIPTYNEEGNILNMAKCLREMYPDFKIMFMDDNSKDRSKELIEGLGDPDTVFVSRDPDDRGLSASIFQGITDCGTEYFMVMDCDFQHPPSVLKEMSEKLAAGSDLVIGVREDRMALGFVRMAGSWAFTAFSNMYLLWHRKKLSKDDMSGLFGGRTELFAPVIRENYGSLERKGWKALLDLLRYGPRDISISNVKYKFATRAEGESKMNPRIVMMTFHQCGCVGRLFAKVYGKLKGIA